MNHLRRAVEAGLDVGVHGPVLKAGGPEVDDLDVPVVQAPQQHVLRLQIAVDDVGVPQYHQSIQDLYSTMRRSVLHFKMLQCLS